MQTFSMHTTETLGAEAANRTSVLEAEVGSALGVLTYAEKSFVQATFNANILLILKAKSLAGSRLKSYSPYRLM